MGSGSTEPLLAHPARSQRHRHFSSMAVREARLTVAWTGGCWGLRLHPESQWGQGRGAAFHLSPRASGAGRGGWTGTASVRASPSRCRRSCGAVPTGCPHRCTQPVYLRPPRIIIFFFCPSLGLTFADKLALISQNVILQLRAKSSQVLSLNSFSKPSLH